MLVRALALCLASVVLTGCGGGATRHRSAEPTFRPAPAHRVTDLPGDVRPTAIEDHLQSLAAIAHDHDDTRVAGSRGYTASRDYVVARLLAAGYRPEVQAFRVTFFWEQHPTRLETTGPSPRQFAHDQDFTTLRFSGSGDVAGTLLPISAHGDGAGCAPDAFGEVKATEDPVVLVLRGGCPFQRKVDLARQAGAEAVLVAPAAGDDSSAAVSGTLLRPAGIPVLGVDADTARTLAATGQVHVTTDVDHDTSTTWNVFAETGAGDPRHVVLAGAHLDSVGAGPGIVDNATGAAGLLAVAEKLSGATNLTHRVRFAWWGGEEEGMLGSRHYVADLAAEDPGALDALSSYVNADMIGSSNFVRLVYGPGPQDSADGPTGSRRPADLLTEWFDAHGLASRTLPFDGRSDYDPFVRVGVPSAGLFSGAEGVKTPAEAKVYGGAAGEPYERCYHRACDTRDRVNADVLVQMTRALAHAVQALAQSPTRDDDVGSGRARHAGAVRVQAEAGWAPLR